MQIVVKTFDRNFDPTILVGNAVVVIDVLRATTVIACALANGAREIVPVADVGEARALARRSSPTALLGGEINNVKIDGFDFGNSPLEYATARVRDARIVLHTTNGTHAVLAAARGTAVWCAAFANLSAVVRKLSMVDDDRVTLLCAGQNGSFSLEDFACAGALVRGVAATRATEPDDAAIAARELFGSNERSLEAFLSQGNHARALAQSGMAQDIAFAARIDRHDVLPAFERGRIVSASA